MKKLVLIITLFFTVHLYSQEIPLPLKCFPLNNTDSGDIISGQMADIHGSVYALADRFGVKGKALSLGKEVIFLFLSMELILKVRKNLLSHIGCMQVKIL